MRTLLISCSTHGQLPYLSAESHAQKAIECLYEVQKLIPFSLHAFTVLPRNCTVLLSVKTLHSLHRILEIYKNTLSAKLRIKPLWKLETQIIEVDSPVITKGLLHMSPVFEGLAESPALFPWSSASNQWSTDPLPKKEITSFI